MITWPIYVLLVVQCAFLSACLGTLLTIHRTMHRASLPKGHPMVPPPPPAPKPPKQEFNLSLRTADGRQELYEAHIAAEALPRAFRYAGKVFVLTPATEPARTPDGAWIFREVES